MRRRDYLSASGLIAASGCLGLFGGNNTADPGTITCADDLQARSTNGPARGSWPTVLHDMRNTGQTDAPGPMGCADTQWTWSQKPQRGMYTAPIAVDQRVYVAHEEIDDTRFVSLNGETGNQQWQYVNHTTQFVPFYTPTFVNDTLYLTSDHAIDAVDLEKRTSRWHLQLHDTLNGQEGLGPARVANGLVYVGADVGAVLAFDANSGERRWTHDIKGLSNGEMTAAANNSNKEARQRGKPYAPVAATADRVYVTSWDFSLYALDAMTGERQWQFSPGIGNLNMMHAPVIVDGKVYTQTEDAILFVLDAETGDQMWVFDDIGEATDGISPIVDEDSVYVIAGTSTENLFLVALDRDERTVRWKRSIGPTFQEPAADADTIYLDYGGGLHAIDKAEGNRIWTLQLQDELAAPVAIAGSAVFVADTSGLVYGVW